MYSIYFISSYVSMFFKPIFVFKDKMAMLLYALGNISLNVLNSLGDKERGAKLTHPPPSYAHEWCKYVLLLLVLE